MTVSGYGSYYNGTNTEVMVPVISIPTVRGLDVNGNTVYWPSGGVVDYTPTPGQPRPYQIPLSPGQSLTYSFTNKDQTSSSMSPVTHFYTSTEHASVDYADIDVRIRCGAVVVTPPASGASVPNPYR